MRETTRIMIALTALALAACGGSDSTGTDGGGTGMDGGGTGTDGGGTGTDGGGTGTDGGGTGTDGGTHVDGGVPTGYRLISLNGEGERVTGVYCSAAHQCIVSTQPGLGDAGHIYATDGSTITATPILANEAWADPLGIGTTGGVGFLGFARVGGLLYARADFATTIFVSASATGDVTTASWTPVHHSSGNNTGGLQLGLGQLSSGTWTLVGGGAVATTSDPITGSSSWTSIYEPPTIPSNLDALRDTAHGNPNAFCNEPPEIGSSPAPLQQVYMAADVSLIVIPSGANNQLGDDPAGVCISTDHGQTFHYAAFTGVARNAGPTGITCTSNDHCIAFGGVDFVDNSAYIYVSINASMGKTSTWMKASTPTLAANTHLNGGTFAPDGTHGWIVGSTEDSSGDRHPLLFVTANGGTSWTDATSDIRDVTPDPELEMVYAFDATHVWIGGENDTLMTIGN